MTILLKRTKKGRSSKEFYLAQHVSSRSYMHPLSIFLLPDVFLFGTESTAASSVSLSHFEKPKLHGGKKIRERKLKILSKLGSEATLAA